MINIKKISDHKKKKIGRPKGWYVWNIHMVNDMNYLIDIAGRSCKQTAIILNGKYGSNFTKNAVIGKRKRLRDI